MIRVVIRRPSQTSNRVRSMGYPRPRIRELVVFAAVILGAWAGIPPPQRHSHRDLAGAIDDTAGDAARAHAVLRRHGLTVAAAAEIGLTSNDLRELGVDDVRVRIKVLSAMAESARSTAGQVQEFAFAVSHYNSSRQWGKCLNVVIKYRYPVPEGSTKAVSFDYRPVRELTLELIEPTVALPIGSEWEDVNLALTSSIMSRFNVTAVSSQIQVMQRTTATIAEPGNHGSTITMGLGILPVDEPLANAFAFDCTVPR